MTALSQEILSLCQNYGMTCKEAEITDFVKEFSNYEHIKELYLVFNVYVQVNDKKYVLQSKPPLINVYIALEAIIKHYLNSFINLEKFVKTMHPSNNGYQLMNVYHKRHPNTKILKFNNWAHNYPFDINFLQDTSLTVNYLNVRDEEFIISKLQGLHLNKLIIEDGYFWCTWETLHEFLSTVKIDSIELRNSTVCLGSGNPEDIRSCISEEELAKRFEQDYSNNLRTILNQIECSNNPTNNIWHKLVTFVNIVKHVTLK